MKTQPPEDRCAVSRCRKPVALTYCGRPFCDDHWRAECEEEAVDQGSSSLQPETLGYAGNGDQHDDAEAADHSANAGPAGESPKGTAARTPVAQNSTEARDVEIDDIRRRADEVDEEFQRHPIELANKAVKLGRRVSDFLSRAGMTKKELAERLGRHPSWVTRITKVAEHAGAGDPLTVEEAMAILRMAHGNVARDTKPPRSAPSASTVEILTASFERLLNLLAWLSSRVRLCVLTNTATTRATKALKAAALIDHFVDNGEARVFGSANKPDVTVLHQSMRHIGCRRDNTLLIGDSYADVECAEMAGIHVIRVFWSDGAGDVQDAVGSKVVRTSDELRDRLETWIARRRDVV